ncbi:NAD(P)H-dependent glycerol-3-phosphate dehydrogenase [Bosea sp. (in: a-proteobacteria)]|uniref:NAD(P)H-dependent glycerol-3-phosphate dehydrogenase n=1 Tax=Bosea sp. (in: a-proteobacteria) TaxID=1871050 RepID=UPI002736D87C|nr:NAD(P)H-dependent glycerol-3-phosphate dehydrogenase [Bosea sp. (in: a-proteobacteria)]MDP3408643.1 NAD(P)H-dependent glycerol-3-phosphate dehydrogenase [Bosea sp. (in: a-proteobacteria)]
MTAGAFGTIGVIGAGAYGAALALAAARAGRTVSLWARDAATIAAIERTRQAPRLPGVALPAAVTATTSLAALASTDALLVTVPTQSLRQVCERLAQILPAGLPVISAAKGIEQATGLFTTQVIAQACPGATPAILSGPSFAADIGLGLPTAVTLAAQDPGLAQALAKALSSPAFRIYHSADPRGVEIGGAAKNVLAIAAGIAIGLGYGESARAALVARGFAELRRFGAAHGAQGETLMGLSGLGDVVLSCASPQSRNFAFGLALGQGRSVADAAGGALAEGAFTAQILAQMARRGGVDMPIAEAVAGIIDGTIGVREAVTGLLARPLRAERERESE